MKVTVIGGGAAGFFAAINIAAKHPGYDVIILEKTSKFLQKVKISGGGRCNVTNESGTAAELVLFYPRGQKKLYTVFKRFSTTDMVEWLQHRGVETKAESDKRMFPITDSSQTIIDCFLREINKYHIKIHHNQSLEELTSEGESWILKTKDSEFQSDKVVVATGASPSSWQVLRKLGMKITKIAPSLFTFNISDNRIKDLQGISFDHAQVRVAGTKLQESGPLLITHWGVSGPAILKLSAWGAYLLEDKKYSFQILINFIGNLKADEIRQKLLSYVDAHPKRKLVNYPLFDLPKRFWERILAVCGIENSTPLGELSKKQVNKLTEELGQGSYQDHGKSTIKEEFVTAGGVDLSEIDLNTFECRRFPGLYLAGEVLDIDALTGGFNFQACWSASWIISESI